MFFVTIAVGIALAAIDQIIKYFVNVNLKPVGTINVIDNLFKLTYVENRGVAFGMFKDMRWVFVAITSLLIIGIIVYMFLKKPDGKFFYVCVSLIIGGGIGNLIDRIVYGYVIDYLSLSFFPPVCNFADYCITAGTIMLIVYVMFFTDFAKSETKTDKLNKVNSGNE